MPTKTTLLTSGTAAANSSNFTVDAGAPAAIHIFGADDTLSAVSVKLERYDGTNYFSCATIKSPGAIVNAPGTYRVKRALVGVAFGVDMEK